MTTMVMGAKRSAKIAISLLYHAADVARGASLRLFGHTRPGRLVVLYYHAVPSQEHFARQMKAVSKGAQVVRPDFEGVLEAGGRYVAITFDDAFQSVAQCALPELVRWELPAAVFVPTGCMGGAPDWGMESGSADALEKVMNAEELRALPDLITLGSHSVSHPHLCSLAASELEQEVVESRRRLEELLERRVTLFAFPYGEHDDRVVQACRKAGYERVFSIIPRLADPSGRDYVRGRVSVDPGDGPLEFYLKRRGAYAWMPFASAVKRALKGARKRGDLRAERS